MTQRERILSIAVGGLFVLVALQWGFTKYRTAVRTRSNRIETLRNEQLQIEERLLQGAYADRQMGEYLSRSLPGNPERARSDYQSWLLDMLHQSELSDPRVNPSGTMPVGDLYRRLSYSVDGRTDLTKLVKMLHAFYSKDYLQRISKLSISPARDKPGQLDLKMSIDALALMAASDESKPIPDQSWRVDPDLTVYQNRILNRNFFEPPNKAPEFTGNSTVEAIIGKETTLPLTFKDPEQHRLSFEFVEQPIESVKLDERTGTLTVKSDEKREFDVLVRVVDSGYPNRTTEQKVTVKVVDPPPEPEPEPEYQFDDATQTVLTGLVRGREDWRAWMNVRTRGKTLKLRVGDEFEIGKVKGKVIDVNAKYVVLESEGRRFELKQGEVLAEAAEQAMVD
ncbi:cadherin repeat domain-containing protein [Novipirellula artificiosorum]|uniref:Cadherin domain-containing protein n=1 Tax=Novipirellula artificiosorum TaxID=2528016 RepID=A0A5C6E3W1_9BACT|nr:cadherin repeat domain-containing protein [Novipirellula artificiosorum]TWU41899.1 hypothetical protein Poly41_01920 [Novipirellula artificiosorum]